MSYRSTFCISKALMVICSTLEKDFGTKFEVKGRTLLSNEGKVGNQIFYTDGNVRCTCN